jgi:hypothetical protein
MTSVRRYSLVLSRPSPLLAVRCLTDMEVFDQLSFLEMFFMTLHRNGTPMAELYQMVQQAGNVVTRLYLLVTVGGVFIRSKAAPAKDILTDLVEMAKGVQQPMRGLFLRYYLSQKTKDKLPDLGSEYEGYDLVCAPCSRFVTVSAVCGCDSVGRVAAWRMLCPSSCKTLGK